MALKAVTLDVGGTLIEPFPSVGHIYAEVASEFSHEIFYPEILNQQFVRAWKAKSGFDYSKSAWKRIVVDSFSGVFQSENIEPLFESIYDRFKDPRVWRIYDDVEPTLRELVNLGIPIGIISNWDDRLRPLLRALDLDHYFDAICVSFEEGLHKPSSGLFEKCCRELKVSPSNCLHVGDSLREDYEGARTAGMEALLVDRKNCRNRDFDIGALGEIVLLFKSYGGAGLPC